FIMIKISDLEEKLHQSKPTIIATFKFLEEKKLFKRLKNGFYQLNIGDKNET
ncbi:ArsR family transcriptional regulator, partial [Campylobacter jejuni]|nr:ArsR family transcriptional regulator [Campylobacter jejuni]